MDSNKTENLSISSTKDSIIKSELATKTKPQKQFWGFFYAIKSVTGSPETSGLFPLLRQNLKSNFEVFFMQ